MRNWFQARLRREQVLIMAFIVMAGVVWLSAAVHRSGVHWQEWRAVRAELAAQQLWLDRQEEIEAAAKVAVDNLDPVRTYDATKLVAVVTSLGTAAGLTLAVDSPVTQRTPQFTYHTSKITARRASLAALLKFYDDLAKQSPYLSLEQIALQGERSAPGMLNVSMEISATQIVK